MIRCYRSIRRYRQLILKTKPFLAWTACRDAEILKLFSARMVGRRENREWSEIKLTDVAPNYFLAVQTHLLFLFFLFAISIFFPLLSLRRQTSQKSLAYLFSAAVGLSLLSLSFGNFCKVEVRPCVVLRSELMFQLPTTTRRGEAKRQSQRAKNIFSLIK